MPRKDGTPSRSGPSGAPSPEAAARRAAGKLTVRLPPAHKAKLLRVAGGLGLTPAALLRQWIDAVADAPHC